MAKRTKKEEKIDFNQRYYETLLRIGIEEAEARDMATMGLKRYPSGTHPYEPLTPEELAQYDRD